MKTCSGFEDLGSGLGVSPLGNGDSVPLADPPGWSWIAP